MVVLTLFFFPNSLDLLSEYVLPQLDVQVSDYLIIPIVESWKVFWSIFIFAFIFDYQNRQGRINFSRILGSFNRPSQWIKLILAYAMYGLSIVAVLLIFIGPLIVYIGLKGNVDSLLAEVTRVPLALAVPLVVVPFAVVEYYAVIMMFFSITLIDGNEKGFKQVLRESIAMTRKGGRPLVLGGIFCSVIAYVPLLIDRGPGPFVEKLEHFLDESYWPSLVFLFAQIFYGVAAVKYYIHSHRVLHEPQERADA